MEQNKITEQLIEKKKYQHSHMYTKKEISEKFKDNEYLTEESKKILHNLAKQHCQNKTQVQINMLWLDKTTARWKIATILNFFLAVVNWKCISYKQLAYIANTSVSNVAETIEILEENGFLKHFRNNKALRTQNEVENYNNKLNGQDNNNLTRSARIKFGCNPFKYIFVSLIKITHTLLKKAGFRLVPFISDIKTKIVIKEKEKPKEEKAYIDWTK